MTFDELFKDLVANNSMKELLGDYYSEDDKEDDSEKPTMHKWTANDFKDDDKLNEFLDETDELLDIYDRLSTTGKEIADNFGFGNINDTLTNLQDYAISVNKKAKEDKKPVVKTSKVRQLAEKYVTEELAGMLGCNAINLSDKVKKTLTDAYEAYGNWVLKQ